MPNSNPPVADAGLLEALLDSWDRNNTILVSLLRALPEGGLRRGLDGGRPDRRPAVHPHALGASRVRLRGRPRVRHGDVPQEEWVDERDPDRIAQMLNDSAKAVREAVRGRLEAGRDMDLHYDHPILLLQHMLWHEGYHHGQIKLALKLAGQPIPDKDAGPVTWGVWMRKTAGRPS